MPLKLAFRDPSNSTVDLERSLDEAIRRTGGASDEKPAASPAAKAEGSDGSPARVASTVGRNTPGGLPSATALKGTHTSASASTPEAIELALRTIAECKERYAEIDDYTCTFHKRERIDGKLLAPHIMSMKARTAPSSIYFKFVTPNKGREAIYVTGKHRGRIVAHDVGWGKLFAGTMHLDPHGSMAMVENRHPITEAGIGSLIDTISKRWSAELKPDESTVVLHPKTLVGDHPCKMIESTHPERRPEYLFHKVKLYISHEHGLPIRFEAYDWPKRHEKHPELVEEYTYMNVRVNVGLGDNDFDPGSKQYSFGRF